MMESGEKDFMGKSTLQRTRLPMLNSLMDRNLLNQEGELRDLNNYFDSVNRDVNDLWDMDGFHVPEGGGYPQASSVRAIPFAYFSAYGHFHPDIADGKDKQWLGFELGSGQVGGIASFVCVDGSLRIAYGGMSEHGYGNIMSIDSLAPTDFTSEDHLYSMKLNESYVEFYIDRELVAIVMFAPHTTDRTYRSFWIHEDTEPFAFAIANGMFPTAHTTLIEGHHEGGEAFTIPFNVRFFRFAPGLKLPPRVFPLKLWNQETRLAGQTIGSGTQITYVYPFQGYEEKKLLFRCSPNDATVNLETRTPEQNWRTIDSWSFTGGNAEMVDIPDELWMGRFEWEPSAYNCTCNEAVLYLR